MVSGHGQWSMGNNNGQWAMAMGYLALALTCRMSASDRPLAYGVVFLRLGGGLGCFSPAIDNYID
jgi:hypothetical protein